MANITVTLPDEAYRRARIRAAELNTSVSALVRRFLLETGTAETDFERRHRNQNELLATVKAFRAGSDAPAGRGGMHDAAGDAPIARNRNGLEIIGASNVSADVRGIRKTNAA